MLGDSKKNIFDWGTGIPEGTCWGDIPLDEETFDSKLEEADPPKNIWKVRAAERKKADDVLIGEATIALNNAQCALNSQTKTLTEKLANFDNIIKMPGFSKAKERDELSPLVNDTYYFKAYCHFGLKEFQPALDALKQIQNISPPKQLLEMRCLERLGKPDAAYEVAKNIEFALKFGSKHAFFRRKQKYPTWREQVEAFKKRYSAAQENKMPASHHRQSAMSANAPSFVPSFARSFLVSWDEAQRSPSAPLKYGEVRILSRERRDENASEVGADAAKKVVCERRNKY